MSPGRVIFSGAKDRQRRSCMNNEKKRILVVDDEPVNLQQLLACLEQPLGAPQASVATSR